MDTQKIKEKLTEIEDATGEIKEELESPEEGKEEEEEEEEEEDK